MINKEIIRDLLQNKNLVMFMTSLVFMAGVMACFYKCEIIWAASITILFITLYA